jgi:hypothetical protein
MLYTTSENHQYRPGAGPVPKKWIETDQSPEDAILDYLERRVRVWDADRAGDRTVDFRFEDGSDWRLHYDWSVNDTGWYTDESGEQPWIVDEYRIERISPEQSQIRDRTPGRDWM